MVASVVTGSTEAYRRRTGIYVVSHVAGLCGVSLRDQRSTGAGIDETIFQTNDQIMEVFADLNRSPSKTKILNAFYQHTVSGVDRKDERCIR